MATPVKLKQQQQAADTPQSTPDISSPKTPQSSSRKRSAPSTPASTLLTKNQVSRVAPSAEFRDLCVSPEELRPSATLTTGQCFHWKAVNCTTQETDMVVTPGGTSAWGTHDATEWVGVLRIAEEKGRAMSIVLAIKETPDTTLYRMLHGPPDLPYDDILHQYFQLGCPLAPLYEEWSQQDPKRLKRIAACIPGVRLIDQDPWECLISFICSTNNNIPRITKMLTAIRQTYGKPLVTIPGGDGVEEDKVLYSFPSLEELKAQATEDDLRNKCGMGYRAKYIMATMDTLESLGGESYLHELRNLDDPVLVQEKLIVFAGVGPKVADCVALFSLRQADAIPVDTHVWNLCRRDYDPDGIFAEVKSITPTVYRQVGDTFRTQFQPKAGWAHSLLFVAELPSFRVALPLDVVQEMEQVSVGTHDSNSFKILSHFCLCCVLKLSSHKICLPHYMNVQFREFEQNRKKELQAAKLKRQKSSP